MSKNWKVNEVAKEIMNGTNKPAAADFGFRYPLTVSYMYRMNEAGLKLLAEAVPDIITMRKFENMLKGDMEKFSDNEEETEAEEDIEEEEAEEKAPKAKRGRKPKKVEEVPDDDDDEEEEEEEEEEPVKKAKKVTKEKPIKKAKKPVDDDDDFDFDD